MAEIWAAKIASFTTIRRSVAQQAQKAAAGEKRLSENTVSLLVFDD